MAGKRHILIIEDSTDLQFLLSQILKGAGYNLAQAYDGQQALTYLKSENEKPSVILLDIMMPIMDGLEFRNRQLNDPELADIPVVMMTADADPAGKAKQMQIKHFFGKSNLDIKKLLKTVDGLVN